MPDQPTLPVRLTPPAGFEPMTEVPGYASVEAQASITVTALPAPFDELRAGFTRENLLARGVALGQEEALTVHGRRAALLQCAQRAGELEVAKWILLLEGDGQTALLTATYPGAGAEAVAEPLRQALLTVRWG